MNLNLNLDGFMKEIQQVATPSKERQIPPISKTTTRRISRESIKREVAKNSLQCHARQWGGIKGRRNQKMHK
ncbi:Uncharacterised protein [Helicobacter mustelae]|nr:Uncharacterised protein [Helicobacter mustelae]